MVVCLFVFFKKKKKRGRLKKKLYIKVFVLVTFGCFFVLFWGIGYFLNSYIGLCG